MACSNTLSSQELIRLTFCNHPSHPTREFLRVIPMSQTRQEVARWDSALQQQQLEQTLQDAAEQTYDAVTQDYSSLGGDALTVGTTMIGAALGMQALHIIGNVFGQDSD